MFTRRGARGNGCWDRFHLMKSGRNLLKISTRTLIARPGVLTPRSGRRAAHQHLINLTLRFHLIGAVDRRHFAGQPFQRCFVKLAF